MIVELTGVPIVAINYRLAPENKFPSSIFDCKKVYDWICSKENEYSWNKGKIIFWGDSAGVNLGLMLVSEYESVNINMYGCVDLLPEENNMYQRSIRSYDIIPSKYNILDSRLSKFSRQMRFFAKLYTTEDMLEKNNLFRKENYSRIKRMLYIEAEFDYFRWSNRYFIKNNLYDIDVDVINYLGVDHGFFERLDYCDEALDFVKRLASYIKSI